MIGNQARRRLLGVILLGSAGVMLVVGFTVLAPRLRGLTFVAYWLGCMGLTLLAALTALIDLWVTRQRLRRAHEQLLSLAIHDFSRSEERSTSGLSKPATDASIPPVSGRKPRSP